MAKKWSIKPKKSSGKAAGDSRIKSGEEPFEEAKVALPKAPHGHDRVPAVSNTNAGIKKSETREEVAKDLGEESDGSQTATPWAKTRAPYRGPAAREEDRVPQGAYPQEFSAIEGAPAEAEQRDQDQFKEKEERRKGKRTREGERRGEKKGKGESTRKEEEGTNPPQLRPDARSDGKSAEKAVKAGAEGDETSSTSEAVTDKPVNSAQEQVAVSMMVQNRRPLPILRDLQIDEATEQKKVAALPGYACSTCQMGPECPEFREGYVCAFDEAFSAFPSRDVNSVMANMVEIADTNKRRLRMAYLNERISSGGMADPNVTNLSRVVMEQMKGLSELQQEMTKVTVQVQGSPRQVSEAMSPQQGPGILSRLFGGSSNPVNPPQMNQSSLPNEATQPTIDVAGELVATPGGEPQGVKRQDESGAGASSSETDENSIPSTSLQG